MGHQLSPLNSTISHKVTVVVIGGALFLAATGTVVALSGTAPAATPVRAADLLYIQPMVRSDAAGSAQRPVQSIGKQAILIQAALLQAAQQATAAHTAAVRAAAERVAAERVAAERAAERAAAERAAQARAAAARTAAQQVATLRTVVQQTPVQSAPPAGTPQAIAEQMLAQYGWTGQSSCLDALWERESGWNVYAENPTSGAYGIPQALPGAKMASAGADWQTDAATQIRWGLAYIQSVYGSPCAAWSHEETSGWY